MKLAQSLEEVEKLSADDSSAAFDCAIVRLMKKVKAGSTRRQGRWMEMSILTLYDHVRSVRGRKQRRQEEEAQTGRLAAAGDVVCESGEAGLH